MSTRPCYEPVCAPGHDGAVELVVEPRSRDLGGFAVKRVLPSAKRRLVGPFIFLDEMGPATFAAGHGIDVRPHPHIGIATITYLFDGELMHRDSLGCTQPIEPGAVNLMTAGRGIVHSERAGRDRHVDSQLHGLQSWIALPDGREEIEPAFEHFAAEALPAVEPKGGARVRLIMGSAYGAASPVPTYSPTLYAEAEMPTGTKLGVPDEYTQRAVYVVAGALEIERAHYEAGSMAVLRAGRGVTLDASAESRVMLVGGEPVGERHIWWNFVSSSRQRIEQAKRDWAEGRFAAVEGDDEFIPLPDS